MLKKLIFKVCSVFNPVFQYYYRNRLKVLAFHTVQDESTFEKKLIYLKRRYSIIGLPELERHVIENSLLPERPLLITFDDGDYSVLAKASPVLQKHQIPTVLFIVTKLINTTLPFWWKAIEANYEYNHARNIIKDLKRKPNRARLELLKSLDKTITQRQLTSGEVHELHDKGVFIGNHTATHPILTSCTDSEVLDELQSSASFFRHENLPGYRVFAYPNGNGNAELQHTLTTNGIEYIFLFDHRINKKKVDRSAISRIMVDVSQDQAEFSVRVSGLHSLMMRLKNR